MRLIDFKVADNLVAGIEVSLSIDVADGYAQINGGVVVAHSANSDASTMNSN